MAREHPEATTELIANAYDAFVREPAQPPSSSRAWRGRSMSELAGGCPVGWVELARPDLSAVLFELAVEGGNGVVAFVSRSAALSLAISVSLAVSW